MTLLAPARRGGFYFAALALALCLASSLSASDQDVQVEVRNGNLQLRAPALHFVTGKALDQLRNGSSVPFDISVSVLTDNRQSVVRRAFERFVLSYDLWEERFSVTRMRSARSSAGHLTANAAEAWCIDRFQVQTPGLPSNKQLWVRIDVKAGEGRNKLALETSEEGFSLASLIELFSRPGKPRGDVQWRAESKPFELSAQGMGPSKAASP